MNSFKRQTSKKNKMCTLKLSFLLFRKNCGEADHTAHMHVTCVTFITPHIPKPHMCSLLCCSAYRHRHCFSLTENSLHNILILFSLKTTL